MAKRKIKSAFKLEGVLDSLGKSWNCNCEVEQGSIISLCFANEFQHHSLHIIVK